MLTLRCTARLLKRLRAGPDESSGPATTSLGDWHANLLYVARKQVVLLVNDRTLLPIVVPSAPVAALAKRFRESTAMVLAALGVSREHIAREVAAMAEVRIARTNSRQILGSMTDFTSMLDAYLNAGEDLMTASLHLAEAPCGPIGMKSPSDVVRAFFGVTSA
jgi:hypothetical protein